MDEDIQETVEALLGNSIKVIDCEKKSTIKEEEILLVNGCPITLDGEDGVAIKDALLHGNIPDCNVLNQILLRAGILRSPVKLETSLSVKSSIVTREEVTVAKGGRIVDGHSRETKEDNVYSSETSEIWEPVGVFPDKLKRATISVTEGPKSGICTSVIPEVASIHRQPSLRQSVANLNSSETVHRQPSLRQSPSNKTCSSAHVDSITSLNSSEKDSKISYSSYTSDSTFNPGIDFTTVRSCPQMKINVNMSDKSDRVNRPFVKSHSSSSSSSLSSSYSPQMPRISSYASDNLHDDTDSYNCYYFDSLNPSVVCLNKLTDSLASGIESVTLDSGASYTQGVPQQLLTQAIKNVATNISSSDKRLLYRDGCLVAGDLSALVQHLVPTPDYYPERPYIFSFLLASRLFIKPFDVLSTVVAICDSQQNINAVPPYDPVLVDFAPRLLSLIKEWCEFFPHDFQDECFLNYVRSLIDRCVIINSNLRKSVDMFLTTLIETLCSLKASEQYVTDLLSSCRVVDSANDLDTLNLVDLCPSERILAEHLCHIELDQLSFIGPEELIQAFSKDHNLSEDAGKVAKRSKNLKCYVEWFNRLSFIVSTEICKQLRKKQRARMIEYWVEVARECFNTGNFNSLMAVIAGLNMSSVKRLKKSWNRVQCDDKLSVLEHQMDPTSNFTSYRSTLKAAMWRSAETKGEKQQIVIPFFSLLMKDIYFLDECCVNKLPNGQINFEKFWQLAKQVTEFITWKQVACPFSRDEKIITFLQQAPILSESGLALTSFEREPPDGSVEKDRYKLLK